MIQYFEQFIKRVSRKVVIAFFANSDLNSVIAS